MNWLLKGIDVPRTLDSKWLSYKPHWTERANCIAVRVIFTLLGIQPLFILPSLELQHPVDRSIAIALGVLWMLVAGYVVLRDVFQFRMMTIGTSLPAKRIEQALMAFAEKEGMHVSNPSEGSLVLRDSTSSEHFNHNRQVIVCVFRNGELMVSLFKEGWRLSMPSLVWHLLIRADLRKQLAEESGPTTTPKA